MLYQASFKCFNWQFLLIEIFGGNCHFCNGCFSITRAILYLSPEAEAESGDLDDGCGHVISRTLHTAHVETAAKTQTHRRGIKISTTRESSGRSYCISAVISKTLTICRLRKTMLWMCLEITVIFWLNTCGSLKNIKDWLKCSTATGDSTWLWCATQSTIYLYLKSSLWAWYS